MAKTVKEPKRVETPVVVDDKKNDSSEYVTLSFRGLTLPWAILLSVIIFTAGIGSALYFGLSSRPAGNVGTNGTPTPSVPTYAASEFAEVTIPFVGGPRLGDANAKVVVLEFSDLVCPYCKKFHDESFESLDNNYFKTGKAALVYKHYPLKFHDPAASFAAKAAYCVEANYGNETMYAFNDLFFARSSTVTQNAYDKNNQPVVNVKEKEFYALFASLKVDSSKIKNCIGTEAAAQRLQSDIAELQKFESDIVGKGLSQGLGTPSFIIGTVKDGVLSGRLIEGAYPTVAFTNVIEEQLKK